MGITGNIYGINGPVITIQGNPGYKMNEMVYVGEHRLVGEVIRLRKWNSFHRGIKTWCIRGGWN